MDYRSSLVSTMQDFFVLNSNRINMSFVGKVISLQDKDGNDATSSNAVFCTVQPLDPEMTAISNILLTPSETQKATLIPVINSTVMVTLTDQYSGFISQIGDVKQVQLAQGKKLYDKRNSLRDKETNREIREKI